MSKIRYFRVFPADECQQIATGLMCCVLAIMEVGDRKSQAQELPDMRTISADLEMPLMVDLPPVAGLRSKRRTNNNRANERVYHSLYLPRDWDAKKKWPILVELTGNGATVDTAISSATSAVVVRRMPVWVSASPRGRVSYGFAVPT